MCMCVGEGINYCEGMYLTLSVSLAFEGWPSTNSVHKCDHWKSEPLGHLKTIKIVREERCGIQDVMQIERDTYWEWTRKREMEREVRNEIVAKFK